MESQTLIRPSREKTFLDIAEIIGKRGTCARAQVGAVIVKGKRIISTGYNGPPPDEHHCSSQTCNIELTCTRSIHAELNAILFAAKEGISIDGATLYCTYAPCAGCARAIVMVGIKRVVYYHPYKDDSGLRILKLHHIEMDRYV
jgi:dCMP deaminase